MIAPSTIADLYPKQSRGKVFALYSGAIPVGSALGYVLGGILEVRMGWQRSFFVVGVPGLLLAVVMFFLHDPVRGAADVEVVGHPADKKMNVFRAYLQLMKNGGFMFTGLGYAAYTFVVGGTAFWMPSYLVRYFDVSLEKANIEFGALTVVGGFIGVFVGGYVADILERKLGNGFLKVCIFAMVLAAPIFWFALTLHNYNQFMIALFVLEMALFMPISPVDAASISYVRPARRATATAFTILLIHLLGDIISRPLMGAISDASGLQAAFEILPIGLVVAGVLWLLGMILYWQPAEWPKEGLQVAALPKHQAHRGNREPAGAGAKENTLAAFRAAAAKGAPMFECDVRFSKDGVVVIAHDDDLKRVAGRPERVIDVSADDLETWAEIPRLIDVLNDKQSPQLANIELKTNEFFGKSGLEKAVIDVIRKAGAEKRVMFSSFNPLSVRRLAKLAPDIPRSLLASADADEENKIYLRKMWLGVLASPNMVNLEDKMITASLMDAYADRGLNVSAWTVNDPKRAQQLLDLGVRSVISDRIYS